MFVNFGSQANRKVFVRAMQPPLLEEFKEWTASLEGLELNELFLFEIRKQIILPFTLQPHTFSLSWAGYKVIELPDAALMDNKNSS